MDITIIFVAEYLFADIPIIVGTVYFWRIFQIFLEQCIYYFYADNPIIFATVYLYEDSLVIFGTVYIFYSTYSVIHLYFWCGGVQDKREEEKNINNPGPGKFIKLRGSKSGLRGRGGGKLKVNEGVRKSIRGVSGGSPHTICQILANLYSKNCQYMYKNKVMEIFFVRASCAEIVHTKY